jgi:hypothetical protein
MELYQQRLDRILKAVALEEPDRTPVVLEYSGFAAHVTGTQMAEFLHSPTKNIQTMIEAYDLIAEGNDLIAEGNDLIAEGNDLFGSGDAINYGSFWPYALSYDFMAKVRVPGVELSADDMWQVQEYELMQPGDYDRILEMGWPEFFDEFMKNRVFDDAPPDFFPPQRKPVDVREMWQTHGVPVLSGGDVTTPLELLCGARSLMEFSMDLIHIPDKVEAAMDEILPHLAGKAVRRAKKLRYPAVWVGGWRSAPCMLSPVMWNRFVWPYFSQLVNEVVKAGLIAILHLDSDWTRELHRFKELPAAKCIMALDGETDIFKAGKVLNEHMCIMGDVSASMLFLQTPQEVREYCAKLIREIGPRGFILQSGCDIPTNAKLENVRAMVASTRI